MSGQYTLTVMDVSAIQEYVFNSNNLKQTIGASHLVECAVRGWAAGSLPKPHNVNNIDDDDFTDDSIEEGWLSAEVVYVGGGVDVIIFSHHDAATEYTRRLSRKILKDSPGLQVVFAHRDFNWDGDRLSLVLEQLRSDLNRKKAGMIPSSPLLGLGVTASCVFTGYPAVDHDEEGRLISREVKAKLDVSKNGQKRLNDYIGEDILNGYELIEDFDELGSKNEKSYLAVIHTDGNNMGKRIQALGRECSGNRDFIQKLRRFSKSVNKAAREALQQTVDKLKRSITIQDDGARSRQLIGGVAEVKNQKIPFRPVVFGGDDITFVCDGRLGLSLAAYYLKQFSSRTLSDGIQAYARAGVAVVKTHYPIARAYTLSEELCREAKNHILEKCASGKLSALDWHFAIGGQALGLKEIREREYTVKWKHGERIEKGRLHMRPVYLDSDDWRSWQTFERLIHEFKEGKRWAGRRNKVKRLREVLRKGPEAVEQFIRACEIKALPPIEGYDNMEKTGWQKGCCGYFDAIEAMDFFVPLEGGKQD